MSAWIFPGEDAQTLVSQAEPATSSPKKKSLADLSEILLHLVLCCLDSSTLVSCQAACRALGTATKKDELWRAKCLEDWGESRRVFPENRSLESIPTFLEAWRGWRRSFDGYQAEDVKRVAVWWAGIEEWMTANLKGVISSLSEGVSEADLNVAEERLGWTLPTHLRLLYRFHNGQWLPWDERLNESLGIEGRPCVLPKIRGSGMSLGLLGGYCFYQFMTSSKLFSLQRGVKAGLATADCFEGEHQGYFKACARKWDTDLDTIRERGGFLLSASHDMSKRAWVGSDGNVRFDAKNAALWGIFDAAPVVPSDNASANGSNSNSVGRGRAEGNLMTWLEEYLRRLQRGHYGVRARWQEPYMDADNHGSVVSGGALRRRTMPGVWLFPQDGGQYCVTEVTKGVQVQVAPVFVPEAGSERTDMLWAYSVRMQLLRDHPTRPQSMTSCQLSTRHWEINGQEGFHREVSGDGVIGEYPVLKLTPPAADGEGRGANSSGGRSTPFEYESCTALESPPGTMGGHFTFTPGDLSAPTGPSFDVKVPTFDIVRPDFIF